MLGFSPLTGAPLASTLEQNIARVSGVEAAALLNSVTVRGTALIEPSGISAAGAIGSVSVIGTANVSLTGVAATTGIGNVTISTEM